jgi:2-polyprenyl-6-methoxyphenol hydroxylase-like FAD-dependent oxidoreductase
MNTEAISLIEDGNTVKGVIAKSGNEIIKIEAELTIGADGRHSTVREKAGFKVIDYNAPVDVLWFRISRNTEENLGSAFYVDKGSLSITLNRGSYWQCGYIIKKDGLEELKQKGLDAFRNKLAELIPPLSGKVSEIKDWDSVKLLSVAVNHLEKWYKSGLICIGDAAHAMSPIGGVGINLAIQDAVAAANILIPAFKSGAITEKHLAAIQERRSRPARLTQKAQVFMHKKVVARTLNNKDKLKFPFALTLARQFPVLNRIPGKLVGMGIKPEHIEVKL